MFVSVFITLAQGQYKQSLHCTQCGHESSSYEAFQYLAVPLPAVSVTINVRLFPYLNIPQYARVRALSLALRQLLARALLGVPRCA